jgi:hypothetical protein
MKNYKVYLIRNKAKEIVYCGLTGGTLEKRLYEHRVRRNLDNTYTIELVVDYLTREEAAILERKLIAQYDLIKNGLNKSPGSINGYSQEHSEEQKRKWSLERKGKPVSPEHAAKNRTARLGKTNGENWKKAQFESHAKPVICLETGAVYPSARHAAKELNLQYSKISLVCNGKRQSTGGLHFEFYKKR